ncbi:hypothetical protein GWK47_030689 [Chionoecetes opilio]|uniref:Uncharacterized protein n=1 Tax=Chionoecetes opilio TaxID=41210 RepID=A0A8J5D538_CHIOP|nr:hypothetical protein GWK47_030689 [Chionoecetes opilio]
MKNEPTEVRTGIHFKKNLTWANIPQWGKVFGSSPKREVHQVPGRRKGKKPQHRGKLEGKERCTCEPALLKITKEHGEKAPELKSSKKKQTHAPSPSIMQQNGDKSSHHARVQTSGLCWGCAQKSLPPVRSGDEEPGQNSGYHPTEPYMGGRVLIHLLMLPFKGVIPQCICWPGEDET